MGRIQIRTICTLLSVTLLVSGPRETWPQAMAEDDETGIVRISDLPVSDIMPSSPSGSQAAPASFQEPRARTPTLNVSPVPSGSNQRTRRALAGTAIGLGLLSERRASRARLGANIVSGRESGFRAATDAGSLLGKSPAVRSVVAQRRNPINTDTRVRATRTGQLAASGSYWIPARADLDTMLSKLDSGLVQDVLVINGPYSATHGPGLNFVDVVLSSSPRTQSGVEDGGSSSVEYKTNGEQWYGRQSLWLAAEDYGFQVSYGHRTGNDYYVGGKRDLSIAESLGAFSNMSAFPGASPALIRPTKEGSIPAGYKSRDLEVLFGFDPTENSRVEFSYLRLDQTDVEFPGLVFDMDYLVTDAWELTWEVDDPGSQDRFKLNTWHNRTRFEGSTFRSGKNQQIPSLIYVLSPTQGLGNAVTNVQQSSSGFQVLVTSGYNGAEFTRGVDLRYLTQNLNDIDNALGLGAFPTANFPLPDAWSVNPGLFAEWNQPTDSGWVLRGGGRLDFVAADASNTFSFSGGRTTAGTLRAEPGQEMFLFSLFATGEYPLNDNLTLRGGAAYAQRPPTLTELYAVSPFIGTLQPGLTYLFGDPLLNPETVKQLDAGISGEWEHFRMSLNGFFAWIDDYITFDSASTGSVQDVFADNRDSHQLHQAIVTNTELATLAGFEFASEADFSRTVSGFATMTFVEGRDRSRQRGPRIFPNGPRSGVPGVEHEPLPGIPPLESRIGIRVTDGEERPDRLVELAVRIVDNQDRVARTLLERETPGFSTWDLRTYWRPNDNWVINAGIENLTDKFYREHLDFRTGFGVYQPGISFYCSTEVTY